jgi:hypothetical protein
MNICSAKLKKSEEGEEMMGKQCEKLHVFFWGGGRKFTDFGARLFVEVCWTEGKVLGSEGGKARAVDNFLNNI